MKEKRRRHKNDDDEGKKRGGLLLLKTAVQPGVSKRASYLHVLEEI